MLFALLPPQWLREEKEAKPIQYEGDLDEAIKYNEEGYGVYYYPNYPSLSPSGWVKAHEIDTFEWVFIDLDMKHGAYVSKDDFVKILLSQSPVPTYIADSGGGIHAYWRVTDLDGMSFLRLSRRLARRFNTDLAVSQLKQLMRLPGTFNTKSKDNFKLCEVIYENFDISYTCEQLDESLPILSLEDETYCKDHYEKAHNINQSVEVSDKMPPKWGQLLRDSKEAKEIWSGNVDDRSKGDYRLGHIMHAYGFSRGEALSVLVNSAKALERAPVHRVNYASNIVDKIWTYEENKGKGELNLSSTVEDILKASPDVESLRGTRFRCWSYLDDTEHGFRLGQVIGLVAGSGVGKTAITLEMFRGFVQNNPDYEHFFIPLEQPGREIADRWRKVCGDNISLHKKVHILSNYGDDGAFRHLSFQEIKEYLLKFKSLTGKNIGCVVIDHIGALKRSGDNGRESIEDICHQMKAFAVELNVLLVMQSQAPREKAGIGDLELNKDAAWGTVFFESYTDYLITLWQPLKRCYKEGSPTVTAFKFCKIRHKNQSKDTIKEDVCYKLYFDSETHRLKGLTQDQEKNFTYFLNRATNKRKQDRKTELVEYTSIQTDESEK